MTPNFVGFPPANACHSPDPDGLTRKPAPRGTHAGSPARIESCPRPRPLRRSPVTGSRARWEKPRGSGCPTQRRRWFPIQADKQATPTAATNKPVRPAPRICGSQHCLGQHKARRKHDETECCSRRHAARIRSLGDDIPCAQELGRSRSWRAADTRKGSRRRKSP